MSADLIARLEKATGPTAELDMEISRAVYGTLAENKFDHFTRSLDAALTLVPEGLDWEIWRVAESYRATLSFKGTGFHASPERTVDSCNVDGNDVQHAAIALCIAALKARGDGQ